MTARAAPVLAAAALFVLAIEPAGAARVPCGRGRILVKPAGTCVTTRSLARGIKGTHDSIGAALVRESGTLRPAAQRPTASLSATTRAAFASWEVAAARAGWAAADKARARRGALARAAQDASGTETLGLQVGGPLGWAESLATVLSDVAGNERRLTGQGPSTTTTEGKLKGPGGEEYTADIEEAKPTGVYCPSDAGIVEASGLFRISRSMTIARKPVTEVFIVTYRITGRVNRYAVLQDYDVDVDLGSQATGRGSIRAHGKAIHISPRATSATAALIDASTISISGDQAPGIRALAAASIAHAQRAGLSFVQNAEERFNNEASCLEPVATPAKVPRGKTKTVSIKVRSRITGKQVESDLKLTPSGGATVTPRTITTTPKQPGKATVTMPAKGSSSAHAATTPSVGIEGRSNDGRATGSVGTAPDRFVVQLALTGTGTFGTYQASGRIDGSYDAVPTGFDAGGSANTWQVAGLPIAWKDVSLVMNDPLCQWRDPTGADTLDVAITSTAEGKLHVTWSTAKATVLSATMWCIADPDSGYHPAATVPLLQLFQMQPSTFELPVEGGTQAVTSTLNPAWVTAGTLTVRPSGT